MLNFKQFCWWFEHLLFSEINEFVPLYQFVGFVQHVDFQTYDILIQDIQV